MSSCCDLWRWLIGDGCKGIEARLARLCPVIPETRDKHIARGLWIELQDEILLLLVGCELAALVQVFGNILVEAADDNDCVLSAIHRSPVVIEAIPPRVVDAWESLLYVSGFARNPA